MPPSGVVSEALYSEGDEQMTRAEKLLRQRARQMIYWATRTGAIKLRAAKEKL